MCILLLIKHTYDLLSVNACFIKNKTLFYLFIWVNLVMRHPNEKKLSFENVTL